MKTIKTLTKINALLLALCLIFLASCKKDKDPDAPSASEYKGVLIINEGGFGQGNASMSYYNPTNADLKDDIFKAANNIPLGDVFQSITKYNGKYYLVINNSKKIVIVNSATLKVEGEITGLLSPRYMQVISNNKAYVTNLFGDEITIIDLNTKAKTGKISLPGWTERMVMTNNKLYVSNYYSSYMFIIDPNTDAVTDSINVGPGSSSLVLDKNNKIWTLSGYDTLKNIKAKLQRINPADKSIETSLEFPGPKDSPYNLQINGTKDKLYYIGGTGAFSTDITAAALPATPFKVGNFYGLGIDPNDGSIYVSDPIDYVQKGLVYRIKTDNSETSFKPGIVPSGFYFNY